MRLAKLLTTVGFIAFSLVCGYARADVDYDISDDCDPDNGWVQIILDDSHDLLMISRDDDELKIQCLMFDADVFDSIPDIFAFSEDELLDMAEEVFDYDNEFDDIQRVIILCRGGNDVVYATNDVPVQIFAFGEEGNDELYGSMLSDNLQGGPGRDRLNGRDGADILHGGNDDETDRLYGGAGIDTFLQYFEMQTFTSYNFTTLQSPISPSRLSRINVSRRLTPTVTTQRVDEENLVDYDEQEDILIEQEI